MPITIGDTEIAVAQLTCLKSQPNGTCDKCGASGTVYVLELEGIGCDDAVLTHTETAVCEECAPVYVQELAHVARSAELQFSYRASKASQAFLGKWTKPGRTSYVQRSAQ